MSLRLSLRTRATGRRAARMAESLDSYLVDVDELTTVAELAEVLRVDPRSLVGASVPPEDTEQTLAERTEVASLSLRDAGILSGSILPPLPHEHLNPGSPRLEVVGGPFAGSVTPLTWGGTLTIGTAQEAGLRVQDPYLLPLHLSLGVTAPAGDGPTPLTASLTPSRDASGVAPVRVNGELITESTQIVPADLVQIGSSIIRLGFEPFSDADLSADEPGLLDFNRPSRIDPSAPTPAVLMPGDKPDDPDKSPLPWLSALVPIVLGVTMALVFQRYVMLLMAAASPIMVIGSFLTNRRLAKRKGERTEEQWIEGIREAETRINTLVRAQRLDSWQRSADPVHVTDIATAPLSRLWERRITDPDARKLRVGVGEADLAVRFEGGSQKDRVTERVVGVSPSPIDVDFAAGPVGLAGPEDAVRSTARAMLTQLATLRSPRDLQIVVLCGDEDAADWEWAQWLPHTQVPGVGAAMGNTDDTRRERLRDISALIDARRRSGEGGRRAAVESEVLLVVDGARRYRTLPGMVGILGDGSAAGVHVLALDSDASRLPEEGKTVVAVDDRDRSLARVETQAKFHSTILLDGCSVPRAERIARSLCSIRHVSGDGDDALIPTSVRYAELLDINLDDPEPIVTRWDHQPRQSYVVVGATAEGEFALDMVADGPHALVAGTTGSGKSEFLQALVVSLALANRPEALNFVLVDYKGGSAFADCERLPHTVGMVTNLDAQETERALASLDAELRRREHVLRDMGARDIDQAWAKDPEQAAERGLARLMLVIDEFAELKTELPEFIDGLVRIARVGRSLGVNLVLATQRPSGVITPEMQSNVNLRVALRVTDRSDSTDVLGSPEAALISPGTPGRGFVRLGAGIAPIAFQTARVAGLRQGTQRVQRVLPPVAPLSWDGLGYPPRFPPVQDTQVTDHDNTDLRALVDLVGAASARIGATLNPSPWLAPLPDRVIADELDAGGAPSESAVAIGLEDVPAEQEQRPFFWDLENDSHLLFVGGSRSGRTSALRTIAGRLVSRFDRDSLQLFLADFGTGALLPFAQAPQCGAVVTQLELHRVQRLLGRLVAELTDRQQTLATTGAGDIIEQRRRAEGTDRMPFLVLGIDGWERLVAALDPDRMMALRDDVLRLLREGPSVGIRVIVTGDRGVLADKLQGFIDDQYILPLRDVNDYRAAGIMIRELPTSQPAGRVLRRGAAASVQLAVLGSDATSSGQSAAIAGIVSEAVDRDAALPVGTPRPLRVDALPTSITLEGALALVSPTGAAGADPILAVGGDTLGAFRLSWPGDGGAIVVGPRGSGRSTALAVLCEQWARAGEQLLVVAPRGGALAMTAERHGVTVLSATDTDVTTLLGLLPASGQVTVIVDDADLLKNTPIEQSLNGIGHRSVFVAASEVEAASTLYSGPFAAARKARVGLLLSPTSSVAGSQVLGQAVPKPMLGRRTAGGGVLLRSGEWTEVRVPSLG
ncbi:MAG: FtsK/SpoIIIE domain-containing protein [Mycetocola sp.]